MKFIIDKKTLTDYLAIVSRTVASNSPTRVLECILFDVSDNLILTSSDMDMGTKTKPIPITVERTGKVAFDAKLFIDIIRKMPNGMITIDCDYNFNTIITNKKARLSINGIEGEEFPELPIFEQKKSFDIKSQDLADLIRKTIFSVGVDESKPTFKGELIETDSNAVSLVSIDGMRISLAKTKIETEANIKEIIPGKALNELLRILPADSNVTVGFTNNHVFFKLEEFIFTSKIIGGEFFNYANSFPHNFTVKAIINRIEFIECLERSLSILHDNKAHPITLSFKESVLLLESTTVLGSQADEIDIEFEGESFVIAFNPKFLIEAIKVIDSEKILMSMNNEHTPCVITAENDGNSKYLILPLRIKR